MGVLSVKWFSGSIWDLRLAEDAISGVAPQRVIDLPCRHQAREC